jgi:hypothetical protein
VRGICIVLNKHWPPFRAETPRDESTSSLGKRSNSVSTDCQASNDTFTRRSSPRENAEGAATRTTLTSQDSRLSTGGEDRKRHAQTKAELSQCLNQYAVVNGHILRRNNYFTSSTQSPRSKIFPRSFSSWRHHHRSFGWTAPLICLPKSLPRLRKPRNTA